MPDPINNPILHNPLLHLEQIFGELYAWRERWDETLVSSLQEDTREALRLLGRTLCTLAQDTPDARTNHSTPQQAPRLR